MLKNEAIQKVHYYITETTSYIIVLLHYYIIFIQLDRNFIGNNYKIHESIF